MSSKQTCECANCDWKGDVEELDEIARFWERVATGERLPAGQCPKCGALAHLVKREALDYPPEWDDITASPAEVDAARRVYSGDQFEIDGVTHIIREDGGFWIHGRMWVPQAPKAEG